MAKYEAKSTGRIIMVRSRAAAFIVTALLIALVFRLGFLQLVDAGDYKNAALEQYTHEVKISASRGTIYDRNMNVLATDAEVHTLLISPYDLAAAMVEDAQKEPDESGTVIVDKQALILRELPSLIGIESSKLEKAIEKKQSKYVKLKTDIEEEESKLISQFIADNELAGILYMETDSKRYYPYGSLASLMIGFTDADNKGVYGAELVYNEYLSGVDGRSVKGTDGTGKELPFKYESYNEAIDGEDLMLTIDINIQATVEKYLQKAYEQHKTNGKVTGIVMDVDTGEILAFAQYPTFDLNDRNTFSAEYQAIYDEKLLAFTVEYDGEEADYQKKYDEYAAKLRGDLIYTMWNNTAVTQTYDPGSTFKIVTSAMALEEKIVSVEDTFQCRTISMGGYRIKCHTATSAMGSHGTLDFMNALSKSCNPAFVDMGLKLGAERFEKYFEAFGYTQKTGTDLYGEASTIYYATTGVEFSELSLATYSFGQTFTVTPIQHIRATSAVANGGTLVTPHIGKYLVSTEGASSSKSAKYDVTHTFEFAQTRQVVSQDTCDIILEALLNSTANSNVLGYNVVTKTGTAEITRTTDIKDDYVGSCVTFAPYEDPQISVMVLVDDPTQNGYYGNVVAAPVVGNILAEVLPYMGIEPSVETEKVKLDSYAGKSVSEAKSALEALGLVVTVKGDGENVVSQMPLRGESVLKGSTVVLYAETAPATTVTVPNLLDKTESQVRSELKALGLNFEPNGIVEGETGDCRSYDQSIPEGTEVSAGTVIKVDFKYLESLG